jgi:hypothetical protein
MEAHNFRKAFFRILIVPKHISSLIGIILFLREIIRNSNVRKKRKYIQRIRKNSDTYVQMLTSGRCQWKCQDKLSRKTKSENHLSSTFL